MWWGVAAALLANVLYSTGFVLEKRALAALPEVDVRRPARLLRLVLGSPLGIGELSWRWPPGSGAQLAVYRTLPIAAAQGIFVSGSRRWCCSPPGCSRGDVGPRAVRARRDPAGPADGGPLPARGRGPGQPRCARAADLTVVCPRWRRACWLYGAAQRRARHRTGMRRRASSTAWRWACCTVSRLSRACPAILRPVTWRRTTCSAPRTRSRSSPARSAWSCPRRRCSAAGPR